MPADIAHPETGELILGRILPAGEELRAYDVYPSEEGEWKKCPRPGALVPGLPHSMIWVRPAQDEAADYHAMQAELQARLRPRNPLKIL